MTTQVMTTHNAIKALKESGMDEKQAETVVDVVTDLNNASAVTKEDLYVTIGPLKTEIAAIHMDLVAIKTDLSWIKKLMFTVGITGVLAALKYIFIA